MNAQFRFFLFAAAIFLSRELVAQDDYLVPPVIASASRAASDAISTFQIPNGLFAELVAAEPDVANPVAFTIDDRGRIFVCETFRQEQGVTDNRSHDETWIDHDLAAQTVADRISYHKKLLPNQGLDYTRCDDRIRMLVDKNGDGVMDESVVYADRFHQIEDGTGAGVLMVGDQLLFTCIPHLWSLRDLDGDGKAEKRTSLQDGFGVRVAFRGHDMHGLIRGPDGRIYFSIGDRGYHLETSDGRVLADPESGAVFRCQPDGSGLEVFATGLRNPQELAFDNFGNLFAGDNNSDSGDKARWVYVLPGSDSGWRMSYQYLPDRGPFNREKIWHLFHNDQPAFIVPPVANIGDGPSGIAFYPGTGFAKGFDDCFFMCDFRGTTANSGIRTFKMQPQGAFFGLVEPKETLWRILPTDLAFGPDGFVYVSDWVDGWVGEGKGRLYRFAELSVVSSVEVSEVRDWLADDVEKMAPQVLRRGLSHRDQRIRLKAQWELAARKDVSTLIETARQGPTLLSRLHGLWGLEQVSLKTPAEGLEKVLAELVIDPDSEIRAQAVRIIGELRINSLSHNVETALADARPRVQMMAALSFRNLTASPESAAAMIALLERNDNQDPAIRHAAIMGLSSVEPSQIVLLTKAHGCESVRRAAVVALRRQRSERVADFLKDESPLVAEEAARAIYDVPITECVGDLANCVGDLRSSAEFNRRAIHACFRMGRASDAERLCKLAIDAKFSLELRSVALEQLGDWGMVKNRDGLLGMWRPTTEREMTPASLSLGKYFRELLMDEDERIRGLAVKAAGRLHPTGAAEVIVDFCRHSGNSAELRAIALDAAAHLAPDEFLKLATEFLSSNELPMRLASRRLLVELAPDSAVDSIVDSLESNLMLERQTGYELVTRLKNPKATQAMTTAMTKLLSGKIPADTRLDVWMAAERIAESDVAIKQQLTAYRARKTDNPKLEKYRDSLMGGDRERGRKLFFERAQLSCLRCHRVGLEGGNVGPNLSEIGQTKDRAYLLQSIVDPNAVIAEKFGTVVVLDETGKTMSGIVHSDGEDILRLLTAEGEMITLAKSTIIERREGKSAMPEDVINHLSPFELRDLVEFLAQQRLAPQPDVESLEIPKAKK